ncbi:MAG: hypothetical protein HQ526_08700, partial [Actinobacteria bacterium]|nr:hypothetical protein [Actinomycetota bacterium]
MKPKTVGAVAAAASFALLGLSACSSDPAPIDITGPPDTLWNEARDGVTGQPWVVGLGDSYISGEGGRWASNGTDNAQFSGTGGWLLGTVDQVYGDAPDGTETIPFCHRTATAPMFIGEGWNSKNLACSGAETGSFVSKDNRLKPGIDFADSATAAGQLVGQAKRLQEFATNNDVKVVALSIGGNDLGFSDIIGACVTGWLKPGKTLCKDSETVAKNINPQTKKIVKEKITAAVFNVNRAMRAAGKKPNEWRLVYSVPPSPLPVAADIDFPDTGYSRQTEGGCGIHDEDLDYANSVILPFVKDSIAGGVAGARELPDMAPITVLDNSNALNGHRLCETGTNRPAAGTGLPPNALGDEVEWVRFLSLDIEISHPEVHDAIEAMHPSYFGQRVLGSCMRAAVETPETTPELACTRPTDATFTGSGLNVATPVT